MFLLHRPRVARVLSRIALGLTLGATALPLAAAQTGTGIVLQAPEPLAVQAIIDGPDDAPVGRTMILNASHSVVPPGATVEYRWTVEGRTQPISTAVDAIYTPDAPGRILFQLTIRVRRGTVVTESQATHVVSAYRRKLVLLADQSVAEPPLVFARETAEQAGVFLKLLRVPRQQATQGVDPLSIVFQTSEDMQNAEAILLWTDGLTGLQALLQAQRADPTAFADLRDQTIVLLTDQPLGTLSRAARGPFSALGPRRILLTRPEAIGPLLLATSAETFAQALQQRGVEHVVMDAQTVTVRPWNLLSWLTTSMLIRGVSTQTIVLLLILPIILTILAFIRQVVGLSTFGLFAPAIVALSFLALGWWVGLLFLLFIIISGSLTRQFMQRWNLLHIPKVAIILSVISLTLLILLAMGASVGVILPRDSVFMLLILSTLGESFLITKTEQGFTAAVWSVAQTIFSALLCVAIVQWPGFQSTLLAYPELVLLTLPINVALGRFTGLRLLEYVRFREVFRHLEE